MIVESKSYIYIYIYIYIHIHMGRAWKYEPDRFVHMLERNKVVAC
jgi:hypothetical protein